jgi:hypothetical protein
MYNKCGICIRINTLKWIGRASRMDVVRQPKRIFGTQTEGIDSEIDPCDIACRMI